MSDDSKVTVRLDADGRLQGLDIDGDLDRDNLVAETPGKAPPLPDEAVAPPSNIWPLG